MDIIATILFKNAPPKRYVAIFEKKDSFVKQIAIYLRQGEHRKAYDLSKALASAFPSQMIGHYLLSKSAFWSEKYDEAYAEAGKALRLAGKTDRPPCAILAASALFRLGRYREGRDLLAGIDDKGNGELEKLRFAFAVAMGNEKEAVRFLEELYKINRKAAEKILTEALGS
jgi:hypothetical protein